MLSFVLCACIFLDLFIYFLGGDISSNSYRIEAVGFSDLSDTSELVENANYKGLRQSGWISIGKTLQSRAESVSLSLSLSGLHLVWQCSFNF